METAGKYGCPQTLSLTGRFGEPQDVNRPTPCAIGHASGLILAWESATIIGL